MQTFLPYADFEKSARALDYKRLGKQRVECKQILKAIVRGGGWRHHPAVNMWRPWPHALIRYYEAMCEEWVRRGYKHEMTLFSEDEIPARKMSAGLPTWLRDESVLASHRSMLISKLPEHYAQEFPNDKPGRPYVWPIKFETSIRIAASNGCGIVSPDCQEVLARPMTHFFVPMPPAKRVVL